MFKLKFHTALLLISLLAVTFGIRPALARDHSHSHQAAQELDEVTVTAKRLESFIENNPRQVEVMARKKIRESNFMEIEAVLDAMSGVSVEPSGSGLGSRISIRGSGGSGRILVLINGRPAAGSQYGSAVLGDIPVSMIGRIEVYKPPVPVWLGSGASSGAINIVLSSDADSVEENKPLCRARISGGSFGTAEASVSKTSVSGDSRLLLSAAGKHTNGSRKNNDRDTANLSAQWEVKAENAKSYDINARYYYSEHGNPGRVYNPTPDAEQKFQKGAADFRARGIMGETGSYTAKVFADGVYLKDSSQSGLVSTLETMGVGAKAEADWCEQTGLWSIRTGALLKHETVDHTLSGEHDRQKTDIHAEFDRTFDPFTVTAGARGDWTSDFDFFPGGSLGLSFKPDPGRIIKAGIGYTVNIPTFGQLYQPSHGSIDQVRGNPDLDEESVVSASLGFTQRSGDSGEISAAVFREDIRDMIAYQEGGDTIKRPVNVAEAWRQGLELNIKWQVLPQTGLNLNYILQKSENKAEGRELTYTPAQKFTATVKQTVRKTSTRLEFDLKAVSEQYSDLENTQTGKMAGYVNVDLKIAQPLNWGQYPFETFVHVFNLFDKDFEVHHGYPDDGFRAFAGLNLEF